MPGDIPRLLEVPLFEGTDIFIAEAARRVYARRLARLTVSLKTKMPGGIPRPLTALHKGTQPIYTTRWALGPSGDDVPASCALKVDSASLADGAHELIYVGHGSCSARVFTAFNKRLSSACCSVRWLARYENPPEFVKGKAGFLVILGSAGFREFGDCLLRCLDENAR